MVKRSIGPDTAKAMLIIEILELKKKQVEVYGGKMPYSYASTLDSMSLVELAAERDSLESTWRPNAKRR
jgi:hypothetical protein